MFSIVEIAGIQFKAELGRQLKVPHLNTDVGKKVSLDRVLLVDDDKKVTVGTPIVTNATVEATILEHGRDRKVVVFKKKRRKGYKTKNTHRQQFTRISIDTIRQKAVKSGSRARQSVSKGRTVGKKTATKRSQIVEQGA